MIKIKDILNSNIAIENYFNKKKRKEDIIALTEYINDYYNQKDLYPYHTGEIFLEENDKKAFIARNKNNKSFLQWISWHDRPYWVSKANEYLDLKRKGYNLKIKSLLGDNNIKLL